MRRMVDSEWSPTDIRYSYGLKHYLYGGNAAAKFYFGDLNFTVGTNIYGYQREHYLDESLKDHWKNVDPSEFYDNTGYKMDINGFAAVNYTLNKFNFGANIQYRHVDFHYTDHMNSIMSFNKNDFDTNWNFVNYGINVSYNINNLNKLYIRYSEVSREPTRTDMFGGNEFFTGELTTNKAERSYDIETGYEVSTNKIKANINLYYMKFKNERVLNGQYGLNGLPLHDTADKSYRMGIEGSVDWNFFDNFHYVFNSALSKNKINTEMYMDQNNEYEIPEFLQFNLFGNYRYKNIEFGARVNNIFNRTNYINAAVGATDILWFRNAGTSVFGDIKFYF
jgi:iron complex outermembrane receptor protein